MRRININRAHSFKPVEFLGGGWMIDEQDERSLALTEIDFSKVRFEDCLKRGDQYITGSEKLERLKRMPVIRLDANIGKTLYEEKRQATLRLVHKYFHISWLEFAGTVLLSPRYDKHFLCLCRGGGGLWFWRCSNLYDHRYSSGKVSPVLQAEL